MNFQKTGNKEFLHHQRLCRQTGMIHQHSPWSNTLGFHMPCYLHIIIRYGTLTLPSSHKVPSPSSKLRSSPSKSLLNTSPEHKFVHPGRIPHLLHPIPKWVPSHNHPTTTILTGYFTSYTHKSIYRLQRRT